MTLNTKEYREYADAAEFFAEEGDQEMAAAALREAVRAAGFDDSQLTYRDLVNILQECHRSIGERKKVTLPAHPFFLRTIVRRFPEGKILEKRM